MLVTDELAAGMAGAPRDRAPARGLRHRTRAARAADGKAPAQPVPTWNWPRMKDPDARENWRFFLTLRDRLLKAGTVEEGYAAIMREGLRLPVVFLSQLGPADPAQRARRLRRPQVLRAPSACSAPSARM
jgi:hypothetical protein